MMKQFLYSTNFEYTSVEERKFIQNPISLRLIEIEKDFETGTVICKLNLIVLRGIGNLTLRRPDPSKTVWFVVILSDLNWIVFLLIVPFVLKLLIVWERKNGGTIGTPFKEPVWPFRVNVPEASLFSSNDVFSDPVTCPFISGINFCRRNLSTLMLADRELPLIEPESLSVEACLNWIVRLFHPTDAVMSRGSATFIVFSVTTGVIWNDVNVFRSKLEIVIFGGRRSFTKFIAERSNKSQGKSRYVLTVVITSASTMYREIRRTFMSLIRCWTACFRR